MIGTLIALALLIPLVITRWRWRSLAWGGLLLIGILEILIVRNVFTPAHLSTQVMRDEDSMSVRFDIWKSGLDIVRDYPLTGVGMNMFRDGRVRALYPVATFKPPVLPHTHNELLQISTDMGVPGLALFVGFYSVAGWMVWRCYRHGTPDVKIVAAGVGAGLLAHLLFGMGDAITLWDRFAFLFWWLLALGCGVWVYGHITLVNPEKVSP